MNMVTKLSLGAILGAALIVACLLFAPRGGTDATATRNKEKLSKTLPQEDSRGEASSEIRPAPATRGNAGSSGDLKSLPAQIHNLQETNQVDKLEELRISLTAQLREGTLSPGQIVELFRSEKDMSVLDVLMGVLKHAESFQPEVVASFIAMAREDAMTDRRHVAIAFLGGVPDRDGSVRSALFTIAKSDADPNLRNAAFSVFREYIEKNRNDAPAVINQLVLMAQTATDAGGRKSALGAIDIRYADGDAVRAMGDFLAKDTSPEVRHAAADALGEVKPAYRAYAISELENAYTRESADGVRSMILDSLVKAGLSEALPALRRLADRSGPLQQAVLDYVRVLESGELNWDRIQAEKHNLEKSRIK